MRLWRKLKAKRLVKKYKGVTSGVAILVLEEECKKRRKRNRYTKMLLKVAEKLPYDTDELYRKFVDAIIQQSCKERGGEQQ